MDFDGTLVESNNIKDRAFETIFCEWPEHTETMMSWHIAHNSTERGEKFRYFVEEVLELSEQKDLIENLIARFRELTKTAIVECPFVMGAEEFLEYFSNRIVVYLVSATPQLDLDHIIKARGLGGYFKDVYGAPVQKDETLKNIILLEKVSVDEILFIGDSSEDQQSAKNIGINFIGMQSDRKLVKTENNIFSDFLRIKKYTEENYAL